MNQTLPKKVKLFNAAVIVAALGYFVDIYDLVLFSIVRVSSLKSIGLSGQDLFDKGLLLINMQMIGMLIGGILWGVLGDKRGRLSVLFGSIFLYSCANLANAFVDSVTSYAILRFIAGIGLAGELGAGITLVSEILPKEKRGYGTMIVATIGVSGAVFAGLTGEYFSWRICYGIGGVLGLSLLALRIGVTESGMFNHVRQQGEIHRGNFFSLFTNRGRFTKYLKCILIGLPLWFVIGILITFSPEFSKVLEVNGTIIAGRAIMFSYGGLVVGDFLSGMISQKLKSRKKVVFLFLVLMTAHVILYLFTRQLSSSLFYALCFGLGLSSGYWAIFATIAAEQFGTNLRATVATTVPNFVRGSVVPLTFMLHFFQKRYDLINAGIIVACFALSIAFVACFKLKDTFDKDLNYIE